MRRWVVDIGCVVLVLVMALGVGVWVRSYWVGGVVWWWGGGATYGVIWNEGTIGVVRIDASSWAGHVGRGWRYDRIPGVHTLTIERSGADRVNWEVGRFQVVRRVSVRADGGWRSEAWGIVPGWGVLVLGVGPGVWWGRRRKVGRRGFEVLGEGEIAEGAR